MILLHYLIFDVKYGMRNLKDPNYLQIFQYGLKNVLLKNKLDNFILKYYILLLRIISF